MILPLTQGTGSEIFLFCHLLHSHTIDKDNSPDGLHVIFVETILCNEKNCNLNRLKQGSSQKALHMFSRGSGIGSLQLCNISGCSANEKILCLFYFQTDSLKAVF